MLLLATTVREIVEYAFARAGKRQPRRKAVVAELAQLDPPAAELVRRWEAARGLAALDAVAELARHVLGADTFFEWESQREQV